MKKYVALSALVVGTFSMIPGGRAVAALYTPGDLVVLQVGLTGSMTALGSKGTACQLDEFTTTGTAVPSATLLLPTTASGSNNPLTVSGSAGSEGALTLSANGGYLVIGGNDTGVGGTTQKNSTVGLIDANGDIDTSTTTTLLTGNNTRSATSVDGSEVWVGGANGIVAEADGSSSGTLITSENSRELTIAPASVSPTSSTQIFDSTQKTPGPGLLTVGTGTPTSSTTVAVLSGMTGTNSPNPFAFFFANPTTLFVADGTDGIQEWTLSSGTWSVAATLAGSDDSLTGSVSGNTVSLFYTTGTSSGWTGGNTLVTDTFDLSGGGFGTPQTLATAPTNTGFSGVAFAPQAVPEPASIGLLALAAGGLVIRRRRN